MTLSPAWIPWWNSRSDPNALIDRAKQGDRNAFDTLRSAHEKQLRGFVIRRGGIEAADDLLQEIWIACWQALPRYAGKSRFKTWLYGIASHKCTDYLREKIQHERRTVETECDEPVQTDAYAAIELQQTIREALTRVPEAQREVLELYYYAELTLAEIAQALDRNLNTVKYQFYRAHGQVARELQTGVDENR